MTQCLLPTLSVRETLFVIVTGMVDFMSSALHYEPL